MNRGVLLKSRREGLREWRTEAKLWYKYRERDTYEKARENVKLYKRDLLNKKEKFRVKVVHSSLQVFLCPGLTVHISITGHLLMPIMLMYLFHSFSTREV